MSDPYEIREAREEDAEGLLQLHRAVFTDAGEGARTREQWRWAFADNPAGRRCFVALHSGRPVAQYAALPQRVWIGGERRNFAQIVDSMVAPEHRGAAGAGLFVRTARAFFDAYGGPDRDLLHFGWPNPRALAIGERSLEYQTLRTQLVLVRDSGPGLHGDASGVREIERFDHQALWLWERCADEMRVSAIRDAEHLNWRFVDAPGRRYRCLGSFDVQGSLRALCVLRRTRFFGREVLAIVDWLSPFAERERAQGLLHAALRETVEGPPVPTLVLLPEWSVWHRWFQERGFLAHPTPYRTIARPFHRRLDLAWLRENWWYSLSDTDLF